MVRTDPIKDVDDADENKNDSKASADEETNDGASKTSSNAARSISFEEPSNDNLTPAEIEGQNDRARQPNHWRLMINFRNTKIEVQQQQIKSQQQQLAEKDAEIKKND